jgi:CheY-like chemotaxis protein
VSAIVPERHTVAIVDDVEGNINEIISIVRRDGFTPIPIRHLPDSVPEASRIIREAAANAICDLRMGALPGAELVADLFQHNVPTVLVSQYVKDDVRTFRHILDMIPQKLDRKELQKANLSRLFDDVVRAQRGEIPELKPYKALIRVEEFVSGNQLFVSVPAWDNGAEEIEMSLDAIPVEQRPLVKEGTRLFGMVNLHAKSKDDLYIKDVHVGQEPDPRNYPIVD